MKNMVVLLIMPERQIQVVLYRVSIHRTSYQVELLPPMNVKQARSLLLMLNEKETLFEVRDPNERILNDGILTKASALDVLIQYQVSISNT